MKRVIGTLILAIVMLVGISCGELEQVNLSERADLQSVTNHIGLGNSGWAFEDKDLNLFVFVREPDDDNLPLTTNPGTGAAFVGIMHDVDYRIEQVGIDDVGFELEWIIVRNIKWDEDEGEGAIYSGNFLDRVQEEVGLVYQDIGWRYGRD